MCNRAAGELRLRNKIGVIEQHDCYHKFFGFWEQQDWQNAIKQFCSHPDFKEELMAQIENELDRRTELAEGAGRVSVESRQASTIRNVRKIVRVAFGDDKARD